MFFYLLSDWVEILQGFTKFNFKLNLKVSAFYLEKRKSFIPIKKRFKPLSISKQKSFVYWLNFPEGFVVEGLYKKLGQQAGWDIYFSMSYELWEAQQHTFAKIQFKPEKIVSLLSLGRHEFAFCWNVGKNKWRSW